MTLHGNDRAMARGRRASASARAAGKSAVQAAIACIEAAALRPAEQLTNRVRRIMALGPQHPEVALRYRNYEDGLPSNIKLCQAIWLIDCEYRRERDMIARSIRLWGQNNRPRIDIMRLRELRLMLRFARRFDAARFAEWRISGDHVE